MTKKKEFYNVDTRFLTPMEPSWEVSEGGVRVKVSSRAWRASQSTRRATSWWQTEKTTGFKCFSRWSYFLSFLRNIV